MNIVSVMKDSSFLGEVPAARQEVELREKDEKIFKELQEKVQNIVKKYYDARRKDIFFIIGDKVLLNTKNLRVRKLCKKLTDRYIGKPPEPVSLDEDDRYQVESIRKERILKGKI